MYSVRHVHKFVTSMGLSCRMSTDMVLILLNVTSDVVPSGL